MIRRALTLATIAGFILIAAFACQGGSDQNDSDLDREIPPETKGAELMDSTRLDPAETGSGPYDTTFQDSGEVNER